VLPAGAGGKGQGQEQKFFAFFFKKEGLLF
jgi:hypothetical protein